MPLPGWLPFELTRPALLAGLVVVPVLAFYFHRGLVDLPRRQRLLSLAVRSLIVLLLVLSLAGLTWLGRSKQLFVVFLVDRSKSLGEDSGETIDRFIDRAVAFAGENRYGFLPFAAEPGAIRSAYRQPGRPLEDEATDIAAALEVALAAIPPHYVPRLVLLSDGNETEGDSLPVALAGRAAIHTIPLETRGDPEVQVSAVEVPAQVAQGEPFHVDVVIDSNHQDQVLVEVFRGPHKIISQEQTLQEGENRFQFRQSIVRDRLAEFSVRVRGATDTLLDNNSQSGLVYAVGKPRALLVESEPKLARYLERALDEEGILVDTRPPRGMPDSLADLDNYELLLLSNVPATDLSPRQMDVVRTYVRDLGGGLIMLGGDQSFGLGGYYKTALEAVLPVRSDFEKERQQPSLAMVLVIDKSGSMGGMKIELAKEAARSAVELLGPRDQIGVIAFEGSPFWVSPMHSCTDKPFLMDRISTIQAGGGTNMYPAMDEAYQALQSTTAKLKHVIILTDGISAPGDFPGITQAMASSRITVSAVGVGQGADQNLLEEIARIGNGRYYFTDDPVTIPQIFAKETMTASKSAIQETPFLPQVIRPSQALAGIDFNTAPFLLGYVITRPKPTSEVVLATESGDPLLAWWRYGLGISAAFTSDAKSRWAAEWLAWPGFSRFWAQLVRHTMRPSEAKGFLVKVDRKGRHAAIRLDAVGPDGQYLNQAETELTLIDPRLGRNKIPMAQTAPGRYSAEIETPTPGAYHLEITQKSQGQVLYRQSRGLVVSYPDELRLRPTNVSLLRSIAEATGGRYDPKPSDVFAPSQQTALRATPLWPYLTTAALLLLLADVALRRIDFSLVLGHPRRPPAIASQQPAG